MSDHDPMVTVQSRFGETETVSLSLYRSYYRPRSWRLVIDGPPSEVNEWVLVDAVDTPHFLDDRADHEIEIWLGRVEFPRTRTALLAEFRRRVWDEANADYDSALAWHINRRRGETDGEPTNRQVEEWGVEAGVSWRRAHPTANRVLFHGELVEELSEREQIEALYRARSEVRNHRRR